RSAGRPLGDRRLYPRIAAEPARGRGGAPAGAAGTAAMTLRALPRSTRIAGVAALLGFGGLLLGLLLAPVALAPAWLAGLICWLALPLGSLVLLMLDPVSGRRFPLPLLRGLAAAAESLPLLALCAVPVFLLLPHFFPWASTAAPAHSRYLNWPFATFRAALCFAIWGSLLWAAPRREIRLAAPALILLLGTITLAAIDWMMSLEAPWRSTVYGMMAGAHWVTAAAGAIALLSAW